MGITPSRQNGPVLTSLIELHLDALERALASFDPRMVSGDDAARLTVLFARGRRLYTAAETTFAQRVVESNCWHSPEHDETAGEWLARQSGIPVGEAQQVLATAERIEGLPEVAESFRRGELSLPQATAIADAATTDPSSQGALLEAARTQRFRDLKGLARRIKHRARSAEDDAARSERHHRARRAGSSVDEDGMGYLWAKLPPEQLGQVQVLWDTETEVLFEDARRAGCPEPKGAFRADALVNLLVRGATGVGGAALSPRMLLRVDVEALLRGHTESDEVCAIPGVGDVPVAAARRLLPDSVLAVVITRGVDVTTVATIGRAVPAAVDLALRWRDPCCVVPGCERTVRLERDHWRVAYVDGGDTSLDNLARLCRMHHQQKTHFGYRLDGGPGRWRWHPPPAFEDDPEQGHTDHQRVSAAERNPPIAAQAWPELAGGLFDSG